MNESEGECPRVFDEENRRWVGGDGTGCVQIVVKPGDVAWLAANHPDVFQRICDGVLEELRCEHPDWFS